MLLVARETEGQIDSAPSFSAEEAAAATNARIDMFMVPTEVERFVALLTAAAESGAMPTERVDVGDGRPRLWPFALGWSTMARARRRSRSR